MSPTLSSFTALIARLEETARSQPAAYRRRLLGLSLLGYGYILLVLALLIGGGIGLFVYSVKADVGDNWLLGGIVRWGVKALVLAAGAAAYFCVRGLFAREAPSPGVELRKKQVPVLFDAIEEARRAAQGPNIHRVVLTGDFNAGVVQRPLLGPLGWYRNEVIVGLPLLDALSPDELRAVLAHEIGHLAGGHGRFAARMYGTRRMWISLLDGLDKHQQVAYWLFAPFFGWYVPYFAAYSLVTARDQEREADRIAATLTGGRALADALLKLNIVGAHLSETFWPAVGRRADDSDAPPAAIFDEVAAELRAGVPAEQASSHLTAALARQASPDDTHPSLPDRLAALGQPSRIPPISAVTAAETYLGDAQSELRAQVNRSWQEDARPAWTARHQEIQAQAARLTELEEQAASAPLSIQDAWERAVLTDSVCGNQWALVRFRQIVRDRPRSALGRLAYGRALLADGDDAGLEMAESVLGLAPELVEQVAELIEEHLTRGGRLTELAEHRQRFQEIRESLEADSNSDAIQHPDAPMLPHGVPAAQLQPLLNRLAACPGLQNAYLVRRPWAAFPDVTLYALVLTRRPDARNVDPMEMLHHFSGAMDMPGNMRLRVLERRDAKLLAAIEQVEGSLIYEHREQESRLVA